jgi:CopG-like RHH_1 or ribbon-helix-helix domain, RHH_5
MDLNEHVEGIHRQFLVAAEAGGEEARALAERLLAPLDAAIRLALQDCLVAAAEEITCELAPGSVEVRLRGRQPEFVVTVPAPEAETVGEEAYPSMAPDGDDGGTSRINLRLPDHLKARLEQAAAREGVSVNSWLVRAAAASLERSEAPRAAGRRAAQGAQRLSGWAR